MAEPITRFIGEHAFLSNFAPSDVWMGGLCFRTVEAAFQAAKTDDLKARMAILQAPTPGEAKKLGRTVPLRDNWEEVKLIVMRCLVTQKFRRGAFDQAFDGQSLHTCLLETYPRPLFEGNTWGDRCWGVDLRTGIGDNHLGRILMDVRYINWIEVNGP